MTDSYSGDTVRRTRIVVCIVALIIIIALCVYLAVILTAKDVILSKEEILSAMEDYDAERSSVCAYIDDFGIGVFDKTRFRDVEFYYEHYYYKEVSVDELALAKDTATLFIEYFYDKTDLCDADAVTEGIINCYIYAFGDEYGVYRNPVDYGNYTESMSGMGVGIGVEITIKYEPLSVQVTDLLPGSGAEAAGIAIGDYLTAVDGATLAELGVDGMKRALSGEVGTEVLVTVLRGEEEMTLPVTRCLYESRIVRYRIDENKIAYISISSFKDNTDDQLKAALASAEADGAVGIIFDLRDNLGGYLSSALNSIELLVEGGVRMASSVSRSGGEKIYTSENEDKVSVPVVVLCDGYTASAGELFTAAVRDFSDMGYLDATIVGTTTYGKGVMQSTFKFNGGAALTLTTALYNPPSGVNYDGVGIVPDVVVELTSHSDTQLEAAIAVLIQKNAN